MDAFGYWEKDGYVLRPARREDAENYFSQNFDPLDPEAARCTGCREAFTREEVTDFFLRALQEEDRRFFLIIAPDGRILGECMLNEIDRDTRCANYRMGIFHPEDRGKGIGTWATKTIRDFAFEQLKLHRLELDVYSFNSRAERVYQKAGFRREGVRREAVLDAEQYADDILMAILEDEWRAWKQKE